MGERKQQDGAGCDSEGDSAVMLLQMVIEIRMMPAVYDST
jgi:hypothetical protein